MKKLGKLRINSEKLLKNNELIALRGGGYGESPCVKCFEWPNFLGYICNVYSCPLEYEQATDLCRQTWYRATDGQCYPYYECYLCE